MRTPRPPPLPALPRAEDESVDRHPEVLDLLGRITPARAHDTYAGLRAAQALVVAATGPRDASAPMHERGEREVHIGTRTRAKPVPGGERRAARVTTSPNTPG